VDMPALLAWSNRTSSEKINVDHGSEGWLC